MSRVEIALSGEQWNFASNPEPFPLFVGGYGSGKSFAAICRLIAKKLKYRNLNVAYYLPTYDLISTIGFPRFSEMLNTMGVRYDLNKSDKTITVGSGKIIFRTMDNPERIIGYEVADSCCDELDTLPIDKARDVWNKVVARNRQKKHDGEVNTIGVATTPEGFRFVHENWVRNPKPGYDVIRASTESNAKNLPAGYIDTLKDLYPEQLLQAYLHGEFVNLTAGTVYRDFDRARCNTTEKIRGTEPLYIGMDFNIENMSAAVAVKRVDGIHVVEELTGIYDTPEMVQAIKSRYPGHRIFVYPDSSGGSRKTVDASTSDLAILSKAGFTIRAARKNPPVKDRIASMNVAFSKSRLRVSATGCVELVRCLEQQAYRKNGEPDKTTGFDHLNDALGYLCYYEFPINKPVSSCSISFAM